MRWRTTAAGSAALVLSLSGCAVVPPGAYPGVRSVPQMAPSHFGEPRGEPAAAGPGPFRGATGDPAEVFRRLGLESGIGQVAAETIRVPPIMVPAADAPVPVVRV